MTSLTRRSTRLLLQWRPEVGRPLRFEGRAKSAHRVVRQRGNARAARFQCLPKSGNAPRMKVSPKFSKRRIACTSCRGLSLDWLPAGWEERFLRAMDTVRSWTLRWASAEQWRAGLFSHNPALARAGAAPRTP